MRRPCALLAIPLAFLGVAATPYVPWEDMTEADWIYSLATRYATVDGHRVHYPTPTSELAAALEQAARTQTAALRHLAEARWELGDRAGALAALETWARAEGPEAWAEAARWSAAHAEIGLAFRAAAQALPGLPAEEKRALADEEIRWADAHPEAGDPLALRQSRARMFAEDGAAVEDWIRALDAAGRLAEADAAVASTTALEAERRLLLRSDLQADHGQHRRAFEILDAALDAPEAWGPEVRQAYARRTDEGHPGAPEAWRISLARTFEPRALLRLATYFQGQGRGAAATDLLREIERRYEAGLDREAWRLLARLQGEVDAVPEAFRATLAAAQKGSAEEQNADLVALVELALRAGGRPLAWGTYNDEPYRWVARLDRTPGFWTGGVSFLLTGQDWKEALARLESESVPERTFATARALLAELERRSPSHPDLPRMRVAIMARHVERGEGREALARLPLVEAGPPEVAQEARRVALLALRQVEGPVSEELRLFRARLAALALDGSRPELAPRAETPGLLRGRGATLRGPGAPMSAWSRPPPPRPAERYGDVLEDAVSRLEQRDPSHRTSLDLILGEMDRLPDAEALWESLAARLEGWSLDDELGPRYDRARERFKGSGWWARAARWYAARARHRDLEGLAAELAARFRSAEIFGRADQASGLTLEIPSQPRAGARVRLVPWADWVRLKALERFPHSPEVFKQARGRLLRRRDWERDQARLDHDVPQQVVVEDALWDERKWALLFVDPARREEFLAALMEKDALEPRLLETEALPARTPVDDLLLFDGWSRLSRFERAAPAADRLAAVYPGDGDLARRALSLHRSLAGLDPAHAAPAAVLVARTAPALLDPNPLFTELGELEEDGGRPQAAAQVWRRLLERDPRSPERVSELATLLWDYGHMAEALTVIEEGRKRIGQPRLLAFEAGVLREELQDLTGAIREYLDAARPDAADCFCSFFERDQRSLRRLSQLLSRGRVVTLVEQRIQALQPGARADEQALASLLPLSRIAMPAGNLDFTADDWIDALDQPNDPVGRAHRAATRADWRPEARRGFQRVGEALLRKTLLMVPHATDLAFLDAVEPWGETLLAEAEARDREVDFKDALLARRADLAPTEEDRITREVARARYLSESGRRQAADGVWSALALRISALPEGAPRMRAEAERAAYFERTRGVEAAAAEWARLSARYPWSLGLLEDRLGFLARTGRGGEGRRVLEAVIPRAASGHREPLLERLAREALEAQDLAQARRAAERLLGEPALEEGHRLAAVHLLARLGFRQDPGFDALTLARAEAPKLKSERQAELYAQLARAADAEKAGPPALALWIEALNRRLERAWIGQACRAAERAGEVDSLRGFFERQQARSPRDVRWAVAVREIRAHVGDMEGAIQMAKAAVAVRPDRESLWREAADLLVRADRVRDAADFLEGWSQPRPADEDAVRRRGELYARTGDGDAALRLESDALEAYARGVMAEEGRRELKERRARAVRRLLEQGYPGQAWRLLFPAEAAPEGLGPTALGPRGEAEVALASGNLLRLLRQRAGDRDFSPAAATVLAERGRPEQMEEVQAFVLARLFPATAPRGDNAALVRWWPFVRAAGLEAPLRAALARRQIAATPGPWQADATAAFVEAAGAAVVGEVTSQRGQRSPAFRSAALEPLWVRDLVRRDRAEALWAFLEPRWQALRAQVRLDTPLASDPRLPWAAWLNERAALEAWARAAAARPERAAEIAAVLGERPRWDRLWALAARGWEMAPLVALLPEEARTAWFRHWQQPSPLDPDPVVRARGETVERVTVALGRLVAGAPDAVADPLIARLRGPRTVGDVLGQDGRWLWPPFAPRRDAAGGLAEAGDDRVIGSRADAGRLPGALWGERPGAAWYALEALARLRERDPEAPLVPLELPQRGRESERTLLAIRLAEAGGNAALALELDEAQSLTSPDTVRLSKRLNLLLRAGEKEKATGVWRAEVRRQQTGLTEAGYRSLRRMAEDLDLGDPLDAMDAGTPLNPGLLAHLYDHKGLAVAGRFHPRDRVDFRAALASRWSGRQASLSPDEVRLFLSELWATGAAALPERGLRTLGGLWPHAGDWLSGLRPADRGAGLDALDALPDATKLQALLAREAVPRSDTVRLLRVRAHLARREPDRALALLDEMLAEVGTDPVSLPAPSPAVLSLDDEGAAGEERAEAPETDPLTARFRAWLAPFREVRRADLVTTRFQEALRSRREKGPVPAAAWGLALELTPEPTVLLRELERAWRRGDWRAEDLGPLVEVLARSAPGEAPRWLARWPASVAYEAVARRVRVLIALKDTAAAARALEQARRRSSWTTAEEIKAFDAWRAVAPEAGAKGAIGGGAEPKPPPAWIAVRAFWKETAAQVGADLAAHLRAHPCDLLAARAVLRSAAPGDEEAMRLAAAALRHPVLEAVGDPEGDAAFLRLRTARGLLAASARAAGAALGAVDPRIMAGDLRQRRIPSAEILAALADVGRIAARASQPRETEAALSTLEDLRPEAARALRAELREMEKPSGPPRSFRLVAGKPAPYRPRDLDFAVVAAALAAEGIR